MPSGGTKIGPARYSCRSVPHIPQYATFILTSSGPHVLIVCQYTRVTAIVLPEFVSDSRNWYLVKTNVASAMEANGLHVRGRNSFEVKDRLPIPSFNVIRA